ncbi:NAD(P)H-dependent oxidoreductase [Yoonia sp. BS5-3]|uniref:NAD(P)H-dependent oxidoreductase n=1 Tax=Yoonia phaeophyticola TaxID=3137369 RepID=A0ABZ2V5L9_9RHOB
MHVLTVLDHPNPASFSGAVAQHFMNGAKAAGHTVELADLHSEGFDPRWTMADVAGTPGPAIQREQDRIARADAICLVFPLYWWGMPAMMKGWVDKVWTWGWAYDQLDDPNRSLQKPRSGLLLVPAGAGADKVEAAGYRQALETAWIDGTFGYFGLAPRRLKLLCGATGSEQRRLGLLKQSYVAGETLAAPDAKPAQTDL